MNNLKENLSLVDFAKLVMSILVMTIHIPFGINKDVDSTISNSIARIAVPFFFFSSGFFFYRNGVPPKQKLLQTLRRLTLLFVGWQITYIIAYWLLSGKAPQFDLQKPLYSFYGITGHLWYIPALITAFILSYFFVKFITVRIGIIFAVSAILIGILGDGYLHLAKKNHLLRVIFFYYYKILPNTRNGVFFGFFFVYLSYLATKYRINKISTGILTFVLLTVFFEYFTIQKYNWGRDFNLYFSISVFAPLLFLYLTSFSKFKIPENISLFCRKYSMGIYFIHPLVRDINFIHVPHLDFWIVVCECLLLIFLIKRFKIPIYSFLLK